MTDYFSIFILFHFEGLGSGLLLYLDALDIKKIKGYPEQMVTIYRSTERTKAEGSVSLQFQLSSALSLFVVIHVQSFYIFVSGREKRE